MEFSYPCKINFIHTCHVNNQTTIGHKNVTPRINPLTHNNQKTGPGMHAFKLNKIPKPHTFETFEIGDFIQQRVGTDVTRSGMFKIL